MTSVVTQDINGAKVIDVRQEHDGSGFVDNYAHFLKTLGKVKRIVLFLRKNNMIDRRNPPWVCYAESGR